MELNIHEKFEAALKEMMARKAPKDEIQKLIDDYRAQKDATVKSPESKPKTEVKKDDFVSSIPGLKEKLVKTQETKNPTVNIPSPKKTTATKVEEPVAETTEQATYDEADFNLESEINQLQKEGLWKDNKKPSDSDPRVNPNDDRISTTLGKKYYKPDGSPMTNKEVREYDDANRVDISGFETASKLVESLKDPAEWAQMYGVFKSRA
jgi:hypothetical protein